LKNHFVSVSKEKLHDPRRETLNWLSLRLFDLILMILLEKNKNEKNPNVIPRNVHRLDADVTNGFGWE